ncbi:MAG: FAD-dependent oxidoreductase [Spirochaetes bacterium]|nr:FAD-dependent oxidoreductase [Spirochaetota bacterium]
MVRKYDIVIIGSGPAGLGAAYHLAETGRFSTALFEKSKISSGGLRNDCKQNYTFPVGFPEELWNSDEASRLLEQTARHLKPDYQTNQNIEMYVKRAEKINVRLIEIIQSHVGTDRAVGLINGLIDNLVSLGTDIFLETEVIDIDFKNNKLILNDNSSVEFKFAVLAPGRAGFSWLQDMMKKSGVSFIDNIVDIGVRIEAKAGNYPVVKDYYDPKFMFPHKVRTFCTNSGAAYVVQEKYDQYYSVNGHSFSRDRKANDLVNFAMLKTIRLTDPVVSGHQFAEILGQMAMKLSGGKPMMQRVGDFRLGKRSKVETFNDDLYYFEPTLKSATPGDLSLAIPAKILRHIWDSLKNLDAIVPGILHPSTIIYYPEIKTYANKPEFMNNFFEVKENIYMIGDGAGTSRGITAAWSSGIRAAEGILSK